MKKLVLSIALSALVSMAICGITQAAYYLTGITITGIMAILSLATATTIALAGRAEAPTRSQLVKRWLSPPLRLAL
jgi:hypothetical protein